MSGQNVNNLNYCLSLSLVRLLPDSEEGGILIVGGQVVAGVSGQNSLKLSLV